MYINRADTVSQALSNGLHYINRAGREQPSRNGPVLVAPAPVMTIYSHPLNRVLFSKVRDANPFFHVMESLWMLAGRNDLPWLTQFNSKFSAYSDDGGATQPGAYGYRWRNYFGYDQLETIIVELKNNPQTRRCVLAMWDAGDKSGDYEQVSGNLNLPDLMSAITGSADVPCNTHAYFDTIDGKLNMTVCCRSNDILWGAYGANAVHFSFLLEYVSACTDLPLGVYRQLSNNFHIYTDVCPREKMMLMARDTDDSDRYTMKDGRHVNRIPAVPALRCVPLVSALDTFKEELTAFFNGEGKTGFLGTVALPMYESYMLFKTRDYRAAIETAETIKAEDWRIACVEWLQRREAIAVMKMKGVI